MNFSETHPLQMLGRIWKPWFLYSPTRLLRRVQATFEPAVPGYSSLTTSWGVELRADPTKTIGHAIRTTGVHDLALSEMLARLISPGDTVVDVGANIGYTTILMALAAGHVGKVIAFEPHPALVEVARRNIEAASRANRIAAVDLRDIAIGDRSGTANLELPDEFESNDGVARIATNPVSSDRSLTVKIETIDNALRGLSVSVMKLDIEGHEHQAMRGAVKTLEARLIQHVVFEDHDVEHSQVAGLLQGHGYQILSFGWSMRGLHLAPVRARSLAKKYESPNFIATLNADEVAARCERRGWLVLGRRMLDRS